LTAVYMYGAFGDGRKDNKQTRHLCDQVAR
jgi:hypothetical protein